MDKLVAKFRAQYSLNDVAKVRGHHGRAQSGDSLVGKEQESMQHRELPHEVWTDCYTDFDDTWYTEWGICLAGPWGDLFRHSLSPRATLSAEFDARTPEEAMERLFELIRRADGSACHPWQINDGLTGLLDGAPASAPYADWFFDDEEGPPLADSAHPLRS